MLCGTSTKMGHGCTSCPISMRSLRSQPLSSALRLKNKTKEQHECTNLMHSDLVQRDVSLLPRFLARPQLLTRVSKLPREHLMRYSRTQPSCGGPIRGRCY